MPLDRILTSKRVALTSVADDSSDDGFPDYRSGVTYDAYPTTGQKNFSSDESLRKFLRISSKENLILTFVEPIDRILPPMEWQIWVRRVTLRNLDHQLSSSDLCLFDFTNRQLIYQNWRFIKGYLLILLRRTSVNSSNSD
ncbi:hypothetical protein RUM43_013971 [Polyplax serrata]|uniref:Uncharacterized protein n=1 Tax=Polyplax serrata TaxID=468196 RepID=A0AAN8NPZ6_POLSC